MDDLRKLSELIQTRNAISREITQMIGRPALLGHLGEYIASRIFDIELETSAVNRGFDGRFRSGPLVGKCVNIKWYAKREGMLDIREDALPDFYLVLAGPRSTSMHSRGADRAWLIESAYLFDAPALVALLQKKHLKLGVATSVSNALWSDAEVFPDARNQVLKLTSEQCSLIKLFAERSAG